MKEESCSILMRFSNGKHNELAEELKQELGFDRSNLYPK